MFLSGMTACKASTGGIAILHILNNDRPPLRIRRKDMSQQRKSLLWWGVKYFAKKVFNAKWGILKGIGLLILYRVLALIALCFLIVIFKRYWTYIIVGVIVLFIIGQFLKPDNKENNN